MKYTNIYVKVCNYKFIYNKIPVGTRINKWNKNIPARCTTCHDIEDLKHAFFDCLEIKDVWERIGQLLNIKVSWDIIVLGSKNNTSLNEKLKNEIIAITKYAIFKRNNQSKWKNTDISVNYIFKIIKWECEKLKTIKQELKHDTLTDKILNEIKSNLQSNDFEGNERGRGEGGM